MMTMWVTLVYFRMFNLLIFLFCIVIISLQTPLSLVPNMDTRSLTSALARLDSFLTLADTDAFRLSGNPKLLVKRVNQRVTRMFVEAYRRLTEAIHDPKNRYEFPATILVRTVDEVETILLQD